MAKAKKKKKVTKPKAKAKPTKAPKAKEAPAKAPKAKGKVLPVSALDIYDEYATAKLDDTIEAVSKIMAETGVENVIIIDKGDEPIGCISALDIVKAIAGIDINKGITEPVKTSEKVEAIMSNIPIVEEGESITEVFEKMDDHDSEIVAVTKKGKLVGCCTLKDLMIDDWTNKDRSFDLVINEKDGTFDLQVIWEK